MELSSLSEIEFAGKSAADIETAVIQTYEAIASRTLAPGDPIRLFLQAIAAIIVQQRALIDYTGKQNLLAYAKEDFLEHIGVLVGTDRLGDAAAQTTLRFTLSAAQSQAVIIPLGTRATPGDDVIFQTTKAAVISAGDVSCDVEAECTETGIGGNGYSPGQINKIVDPIQWVASVANTTMSEGGAEVEADDAYRERIRQAPERFSTAGPDGAYLYHAKAASALISDVSVYSPSPGIVEIRPLLVNGAIPGQEILDAVSAACTDKTVRPLTDKVNVLAPEIIQYTVNLTYWIDGANATAASTIQTAVSKAVEGWVLWQKTKLGRDINPSELIARIQSAGAKRVQVTEPIYTVVSKAQVSVASSVSIVFGGLEDG